MYKSMVLDTVVVRGMSGRSWREIECVRPTMLWRRLRLSFDEEFSAVTFMIGQWYLGLPDSCSGPNT